MALKGKAPSSEIYCSTPMVSTYFGPFSSHTVNTVEGLSVSAQLNS